MKNLSAFDIIGPVMIGPSSSHTAGAVRIGKICREIAGFDFTEAKIYLHGSFARTYRGHGTDRAIIAGLLGLQTDDSRIKESFRLAREQGLKYQFIETDLGSCHPNTARIVLKAPDGGETEVVASSIGGGKIVVKEINGFAVDLAGDYHTLLTWHHDRPGVIARITGILDRYSLNIAFMKVFRRRRGSLATAVIQLDEVVDGLMDDIEKIPHVTRAKLIRPVN